MTEEKTAVIGELVKRLQERRVNMPLHAFYSERVPDALCEEAARAITTLESRCAELEKERDDAQSVHRWNVDEGPSGTLYVCRHSHDKSDHCEWEEFEPVRDRIEREPVVKALEWKPTHGGKWLRASAVGFTYEVRANDSRIEEKKARAHAQFERQILSALASAPERVEAEPVAWRVYAGGRYDVYADAGVAAARAHYLKSSVEPLYASPPAPVVTDNALVQALEPFAKLFDRALDEPGLAEDDDTVFFGNKAGRRVTYGDFRRARAALASREAT